MPKRWLSVRGRLDPAESKEPSPSAIAQQNFDFAFPSPIPSKDALKNTAISSLHSPRDRPMTSGGIVEGRKKKYLRANLEHMRPKTSECSKPGPFASSHTNRLDNGLIGIAFGSPGHPPMAFCTTVISGAGSTPVGSLMPAQSSDEVGAQSGRMKKFGSLFRPKGPSKQPSESRTPRLYEKPSSSKLMKVSLPKSHKRKQEAESKPSEKYSEALTSWLASPADMGKSSLSSPEHQTSIPKIENFGQKALPRLELSFSKLGLDPSETPHRSQMTLNGHTRAGSKSLLARRSKTLENLRVHETHQHAKSTGSHITIDSTSALLSPLKPPRRLTSPTLSRSPGYSLFPSASPSNSRYNLFPPRSTSHGRLPSQASNGDSTLRRVATSPARLSPMQDSFEVEKPGPLKLRKNDSEVASAEDFTESTDQEAPWSSDASVQSFGSSRTSTEEIFFDIRSFRDSGFDGPQFEMTRPDSTEVQLRRTRSKAAAQVKKSQLSRQVDDPDKQERSTVSMAFDETIEAVKKLASPSSDRLPENAPMEQSQPIILNDIPRTPNNKILTIPPLSNSKSFSSIGGLHVDGAAHAMLSPVTERSEEPSPKPATATTDPKTKLGPIASMVTAGSVTPLTPARASSEYGVRDSMSPPHPPIPSINTSTPVEPAQLTPARASSDFGTHDYTAELPLPSIAVEKVEKEPLPPPVPAKDARFIPISKYAAKNLHNTVKARTGLSPARSARAATDLVGHIAIGKPISSATLQGNHPARLPPPPSTNTSLRGLEKVAMPAIVQASPVAEVSIARTVSLSRKLSARKLTVPPTQHDKPSQSYGVIGLGLGRASSKRDNPKVGGETSGLNGMSPVQHLKEFKEGEKLMPKRALSPVVVESDRSHKPGVSMNLVIENV